MEIAINHWNCLDRVQNAGERLEPQQKLGSHLHRRERLNKAWQGRAGHRRHREKRAWDSLVRSLGVQLRRLIKSQVSLGSRLGSTLFPDGCSWLVPTFFSSQFSHLKNTVDNHHSIRKWGWGLNEIIYAKYLERLVHSTPSQASAVSGISEDSGRSSGLQEGWVRKSSGRRRYWGQAGRCQELQIHQQVK